MLCLLSLLFIFLVPQHEEDDDLYTVGGTVFTFSDDGKPGPVVGATVTLIAGKDTLYTVSDKSGRYELSFDESFEVDLGVSCVGYEQHREKYQLLSSHTAISVQLKPSAEQIDGAKVVGETTFMTKVADTIAYRFNKKD